MTTPAQQSVKKRWWERSAFQTALLTLCVSFAAWPADESFLEYMDVTRRVEVVTLLFGAFGISKVNSSYKEKPVEQPTPTA